MPVDRGTVFEVEVASRPVGGDLDVRKGVAHLPVFAAVLGLAIAHGCVHQSCARDSGPGDGSVGEVVVAAVVFVDR